VGTLPPPPFAIYAQNDTPETQGVTRRTKKTKLTYKAMRIDILTVLPEMIEGFFDCSIMARAKKKGLADIVIHNIRDYTTDKHRRTDNYPFG
jgi:hypothetical protein